MALPDIECLPMYSPNRSAVIVRPKQPYIDWAVENGDGMTPDPNEEAFLYLIPEFDTTEQGMQILEGYFPMIFEHELASWDEDVTTWPEERDFQTFLEWFDIELCATPIDLCFDDDAETVH
jgi:hypothetical protein